MTRLLCAFGLALTLLGSAFATPEFVTHNPTDAAFGEPSGTTVRNPAIPREDEAVTIYAKIGYSFFYTDVAIYYTLDGTTPSGSKGNAGTGSTQVLRSSNGGVTFLRNEGSNPTQMDWWKAALPASARVYGQTVKYIIGAWHSGGGPEIWANNAGCSDGVCDNPSNPATVFSYTNKLAWPGGGAGSSHPATGYPDVSFWKEEAVTGNNYINVQLDQNGTVYDIYYPSAGCVQGMGTKNEGYVDGLDTFPPGLPLGSRGQMNLNQLMAGIRVDGTTYWMSNQNGAGYSSVTQNYQANSNSVHGSMILTGGGNSITVEQYDFSPYGISFPVDLALNPNRGIYVKRFLLTNNGASSKTINFYTYGDFALNGGDAYDTMLFDSGRGAMVATDNVARTTSGSGEYNPASYGDYTKSVSVVLAVGMKQLSSVGGVAGSAATDSWRDTSSDNGQGWIGSKVTLPPGVTKEIDVIVAGGFDNFIATGTYSVQVAPVLDWFANVSAQSILTTTDSTWQAWLNQGTTVDFPGTTYDDLFNRSLLATALHLDGKGGGVVAGMHNGAYPFVWPRDAVYAAITLARTGHFGEASEVYRFLKDVAYRDYDSGLGMKGFWYQKYTTDGYKIWTSPQVDETACFPWGVLYQYNTTGDSSWLSSMASVTREAAFASSTDSAIDSRLYYDDPNQLMHGNNVWEDSFDDFIYSNAQVERGLRDASTIMTLTGNASDAATFTSRADSIHNGIVGRLNWNGENTDISQLGISYPFNVVAVNGTQAKKVVDRINGVATDAFGNTHPLVNTSGEWTGLINRYWGDTYWNGGPWFLSTLWYGLYYAERCDVTAGQGDIDVHKSKLDLCINRLGPVGLGAEQIAPTNSLLYSGQSNFSLQTAWPNAWESMSTLLDALMIFLDMTPDAPGNTLRIAPKLPTAWPTMTFRNVRLGAHRFDITVTKQKSSMMLTVTNLTGGAANLSAWIKLPSGMTSGGAAMNGSRVTSFLDKPAGRVKVEGALLTGVGAVSTVEVRFQAAGRIFPALN